MRQLELFPEKDAFQEGDRIVCRGTFSGGELGTVTHKLENFPYGELYLPVKLDNWTGIQCICIERVTHI